jgi:sugar diacid utilization regulator
MISLAADSASCSDLRGIVSPALVEGAVDNDLGDRRRRRALVNDLVAGVDNHSAYDRARELGHDLRGRHWMVVTQYRDQPADGALAQAVELVAGSLLMGQLTGRRAGLVLLMARRPTDSAADEDLPWMDLHSDVSLRVDRSAVEIGVGGACEAPANIPRSWREALRALAIRQAARTPGGVKVYDELGISRFLPEGTSQRDVEVFVRHWLGPVLDYGTEHGTELVTTLATYLDHGGDLAATATELRIHRSTLRYRLYRIAELSIRSPTAHDIADTRNWPSLQVAVWTDQILTASRWEAP